MSLPIASPCSLCATLYGGSCCNGYRGHSLILLAPHEVERIKAATGREDAFCDRVPNERERFALAALKLCSSRTTSFKTNARGDCPFLGDKGCELDKDLRPYVCRTFPFIYERGVWSFAPPNGGCFAFDQARGDFDGGVRLFNIDRKWLEARRAEFERGISDHANRS